MLTMEIKLVPFGLMKPEGVATLNIANEGRPNYRFWVTTDKGRIAEGHYLCNVSAHRNPFDHLEVILPMLRQTLQKQGANYCTTAWDK